MATSGSQNFTQTRNQIIQDAFGLLGLYGIGRTLSAEDESFANNILNKMVKAWATKGLHLWAKEEGVLFLTPNTASYTIGNASTDANCCLASDFVMTRLNGALTSSATSLTVDSTTGMATSDRIGIVLSTNAIHWTTIATIPSSTTLTINSGVSSAAADNAYVYTYTNRIYTPNRILSARLTTGFDAGSTSDVVDRIMTSVSYQDYFNMPSKTTGGTPNQFHYNPDLNNGTMYVWPRPTTGNERVTFTYERVLEDLDNASDNFDFPSAWLEPLTYQLAVRLGPAFGKDKRSMMLTPIAKDTLENLLAWDGEIDTVSIVPAVGGR